MSKTKAPQSSIGKYLAELEKQNKETDNKQPKKASKTKGKKKK